MEIALVVSLAAFLVSATALWRTVLKPATLAIDVIDYRVQGGGTNNVPAVHGMNVDFAVSNDGARAAVITRIDVMDVEAVGWSEFATGAVEGEFYTPTLADPSDGTPKRTPRTAPPGDLATVRLSFKLDGALRTAAGTLPEPDLTHIAEGFARLQEVILVLRVSYRRSGLFRARRQTEAQEKLVIPREAFTRPVVDFWSGQREFENLAEIVGEGRS